MNSLSCVLTLWDPMDCSLPSSSVHGIFQATVLEWIAISFSRGFSWPRDWTRVSYIAGRCFTVLVTREATKPYKQGAGKDWRQEEKEVTEGEIAGWHHQLNGHEFEQTPGDSEGQRSLVCYSPWGRRVRQDWVIEQQPWRVQHFLSFQLLKKRKNTLKAKYFGFLSKKRCCCC